MKWVSAQVIAQKCWAKGLYSLFVNVNDLNFIPGQFTYLADPTNDKLFRPYSFVNAKGPNCEFYYSLISQKGLSGFLANLQTGDEVLIHPQGRGRFTLDAVPECKNLWCFATGTGLGVFLSLLSDPKTWQRFEQIILVHSVRESVHLTHQDVIRQWQQQPHFRFIPIVTEGNADYRLTSQLSDGRLEKACGITFNPSTCHAMLCGNPAMIADCSDLLTQRGATTITVEKYWKG